MLFNKKGGMDKFFDFLFTVIAAVFIFIFLFGVIEKQVEDREEITKLELNKVAAKENLLRVLNQPFESSLTSADIIFIHDDYNASKQDFDLLFTSTFENQARDIFIEHPGEAGNKIMYNKNLDSNYASGSEAAFVTINLLNQNQVLLRLK